MLAFDDQRTLALCGSPPLQGFQACDNICCLAPHEVENLPLHSLRIADDDWGSRSRRTENNDPWVNCRNCGEKRRSLSTYSVDKNSWFSPRLALNLTCESGFLPRSLSWILLPQRQGKECYLEANKYNCLQRIDVFCSFTPGTPVSKTSVFRDTSSAHQIRQYCLAYKISHARHSAKLNIPTFLLVKSPIWCHNTLSVL